MPLLIDGHNLIGQSRDLKLSDPNDESKLLHRLTRFAAKSKRQIHVVFDPGPNDGAPDLWDAREEHGRVTAQWAPKGGTADAVIKAIVGDARDRRGLIVITSDGAVASFVRACGVRVQSSSEFYREMQNALGEKFDPEAKPHQSSKSEIDEWLSVFKEPESKSKTPSPLPFKDPVSDAERKRQRRMEQLRKQTRGGGKLN
jgi:predicted RNA-binding protein with PIN domain